MTQEQEIKGILVNFFRNGTNEDYLEALNCAIKEIQQVKNCPIPDVGQSLPTDSEIEEMANEIPVFPPLTIAKEHRAKWIQGAKVLRDKLAQSK